MDPKKESETQSMPQMQESILGCSKKKEEITNLAGKTQALYPNT